MYNKLPLLLLLFLLCSCLREKDGDCPPEYRVVLGVKDKNYVNAGNIPGLAIRDEQSSFRESVGDLYYQLQDLASGKILYQSGHVVVAGSELTYPIDLSDFPAGHYVLTVFGNISDLPGVKDGGVTYPLHPNSIEGPDTYILSDTFELSPASVEQYVELTRTKGAVLVVIDNLPDSVAMVSMQVQSVYQDIEQVNGYTGETMVTKTFTGVLHPTANLLTVLAPTVTGKESLLRLGLYTAGSTTPFMFIPDVYLKINRNEVTAFKMNFRPEGGVEVWMYQDGSWVKFHDIDIMDN